MLDSIRGNVRILARRQIQQIALGVFVHQGLHPLFGGFEGLLTGSGEFDAAFEVFETFVEVQVAAFQGIDQSFQFFQGGFEACDAVVVLRRRSVG